MLHNSKQLSLIAVLMAACLTAACKNNNLPVAPEVARPVQSQLFSLSIVGERTVKIGATLALKVSGATDQDVPVQVSQVRVWKSSDTAIATVDSKGLVKGMKAGTVTIKATITNPDREASISLRVLAAGESPIPPSDGGIKAGGDDFQPNNGSGALPEGSGPAVPSGVTMVLYPANPRVGLGERLRLVALQGPDGRQVPGAATWRSSDTAIATIDEAGNVTGVSNGTVTITASSLAFPSLRTTTVVSVIAPVKSSEIAGIRISPTRVTMNVGETFWLLAEVPTASGGFDPHVRWEVADESIVTVSETGQITALKAGKTIVRAIATTYDRSELSAYVPVEVRNAVIFN